MRFFLESVMQVVLMVTFVGAQMEGDQCTFNKTGRVGKCLHLSKCPVALKAALEESVSPQICALDGTVPVVCCDGVFEGSDCTLNRTGIAGVCRPFANCQTARDAASKGILSQKCDLTDNESELVCCAKAACPALPKELVTQLPTGSKAVDYCIELAEKIHPCQETRSGWTRGDMCLLTPYPKTEYQSSITTAAIAPYYGRMGANVKGNYGWWSSPVTLVSDRWVLCSANIITDIGLNKIQFVGLGGTFIPSYNPDEVYGVSKQHIHPLYNRSYSYVYNDIALLQLDREVTFTGRILPVCLHTGTPLPTSGFIYISNNYKTTMQLLSDEECSREFPTGTSLHPVGVKYDVEICSHPVNTTGECPEDWYSGSPLTLSNSPRVACTHLLVGLGSTLIDSPCTVSNTRISGFIPWIEGIVWPESGVVH